MRGRSRRSSNYISAWPGFVDVLSALLMVVIFVLMIFTLAQFMLSETLFGQKQELTTLHGQINELTELLGLEKEKSALLSTDVSRLADTISGLTSEKERLQSTVADFEVKARHDAEQIKEQMLLTASLQEDINALRQVRDQLEERVTELAAAITDKDERIGTLRDRSKALEFQLADQAETTMLAQRQIEQQDVRIQALTAVLDSQQEALAGERQLTAAARAEVTLLTDQITRLQAQLRQISNALDLAESEKEQQDETIAELGKQLNIALARKVGELEKYRSEFFAQLQQVLGDRPEFQIQGDRFVLQAGILFESGSADLGAAGGNHLDALAAILLQIAQEMPSDLNWILRIDGHTDRVPIRTAAFTSNWELSTARALAVVKHLASKGVPEQRMAAAGFSKFHPLDPADTPEAYQKNRRIEIKLTSQ
ncbi:MAG: OmpA family protein [Pelovirga sp.]